MIWSSLPAFRRPRTAVRAAVVALILLAAMLQAVPAHAGTPGSATGLTRAGNTYTIATNTAARIRVTLTRADIFRVWAAPNGTFTEPAANEITVRTDFGGVASTMTDDGTAFRITTAAVVIRINKNPLTMQVLAPGRAARSGGRHNRSDWSAGRTTQRLVRDADEQFYGTGLRLGRVGAARQDGADRHGQPVAENTNASPAPFYLSTNGYGVLRNTWAAGSYGFTAPVTTTHNEERFDAYYFVGDSLKARARRVHRRDRQAVPEPDVGPRTRQRRLLQRVQPRPTRATTTGPGTRRTPDVLGVRAGSPGQGHAVRAGSCPTTGTAAATPTCRRPSPAPRHSASRPACGPPPGSASIDYEVGTAGSRGVKTDVAWVGGGYHDAFRGVQQAVDGIERNSDARRYVWTVDGWAGTPAQRRRLDR